MFRSLGRVTVTTSGTPVRLTINETDQKVRYPCQTIFVQQVQGNTGKLYICDRSNANITTGVGVLATIPIPTGAPATILPYAQVTIPTAPSALCANDYFLDADTNGEAGQVSAVRH